MNKGNVKKEMRVKDIMFLCIFARGYEELGYSHNIY